MCVVCALLDIGRDVIEGEILSEPLGSSNLFHGDGEEQRFPERY